MYLDVLSAKWNSRSDYVHNTVLFLKTRLIVFRNQIREFNWNVLSATACASLTSIISDILLEKGRVVVYHSECLELLEITIEKWPIVGPYSLHGVERHWGMGCLYYVCVPLMPSGPGVMNIDLGDL